MTLKNKIQLTLVLLKSDTDFRLIGPKFTSPARPGEFSGFGLFEMSGRKFKDKQALTGLVMHTHATVSWDPKSFWKIEARRVVLKSVSN